MHQDATWHGGSPRPRRHCVRWVPSFPPKGHSPQFSAHVYCGQTAEWINIALGTEVGLGPSHIVLDGDPTSLPKKRHSPQFSAHVYCGQTVEWIKMPLGTKIGLGPGHIVLHRHPAPPPKSGTAPNFRLMSIVATRSPISATAGHLFWFWAVDWAG